MPSLNNYEVTLPCSLLRTLPLPLTPSGIISLNFQGSSSCFPWVSVPRFLPSYANLEFVARLLVFIAARNCFQTVLLGVDLNDMTVRLALGTLQFGKFFWSLEHLLVWHLVCSGSGQANWIMLPMLLNNINAFLYSITFLVTCKIFTFMTQKISPQSMFCLGRQLWRV